MKTTEKGSIAPMKKTTLIIIIVCGMVVGTAAGVYLVLFHDLPEIRKLESFQPSSVSRIYSSDQVLLAELYAERRDVVPLSQVPEYLKTALITTEDRTFYTHSGIDLKGVLRALVKDVKARKFVEGASTISQQLAKTLFLTNRKTVGRKLKEALLAFQLERRYTKNEILELYLNQVYFGSGAYGIQSAAALYFGKQAWDLTLPECALIAAMPKSPSRYSPLVNPELALKRRNIVLRQMRQTGQIDNQAYRAAVETPVTPAEVHDRSRQAPYFVDWVIRHLEDRIGPTRLYKGGLTVRTTLDHALQQTAEKALLNRLGELEKRMAANGITDAAPQGAVLSIDVDTGGVLCMVGGRDYSQSVYNRAVSAKRQPGSAFKPLVFACAVENGFAQNTILQDSPVAFHIPGRDTPWRPENFSRTYSGEITLRKALTRSKNIPAVRLYEQVGGQAVIALARKVGITSPLSPYLSLALGTSEVNLMELTAAYAVFPNQGNYLPPVGITLVSDSRGRVLWQPASYEQVAVSRNTAAIMVDMLQGVIREGTGRRAQTLSRPLGGKTGTTNDYKDALFVGFSPRVTTGVWVGRDVHNTLGPGETGARAALPIWIDVMQKVLEDHSVQYFDRPDDTVAVSIDPVSGHWMPPGSPGSVTALFLTGTQPNNPLN
jgi:penicillin-binding protein 1A